MKRYVFVLILLFLAGCATTVAPPHTYISESEDGTEMVIGARAVNGFYRDDIFITVNGEDVLSGDITLWRLYDNLSGIYQGKHIQADCYALNDGIKTLTRHYCTIYIEDKKITKLAF